MKTEVEIRAKVVSIEHSHEFKNHAEYLGYMAALKWVLGPMPPEKAVAFACPKCSSAILKIEPCSGYYSYTIHKYTGEVLYGTNDFNSESTDDPWYECERCQWKADGKWTDWYEKERPRDEEDSDG